MSIQLQFQRGMRNLWVPLWKKVHKKSSIVQLNCECFPNHSSRFSSKPCACLHKSTRAYISPTWTSHYLTSSSIQILDIFQEIRSNIWKKQLSSKQTYSKRMKTSGIFQSHPLAHKPYLFFAARPHYSFYWYLIII